MLFKKEEANNHNANYDNHSHNHNSKEQNIDVPSTLPDTLMDKKSTNLKPKPKQQIQEETKIEPQYSRRIPPEIVYEKIPEKKEDAITLKSEKYFPEEKTRHDMEKYDDYNDHFFDELKKRYVEEKKQVHDHVNSSDSVLIKLKDYHESRLTGGSFFLSQQDVDRQIQKKLLELKELEEEWLIRFKEMETAKILLLEKEFEIESKLELFKKTFNKAERFRVLNTRVNEDKVFRLENGQTIYTLKELIKALRDMDDNIFKHHVHYGKNDFSNWIRYVFHEDNLAHDLFKASTKEEMLDILNKY